MNEQTRSFTPSSVFKQSVFKHVRKRGEVVDGPAYSHERANTAAVVVGVERQLLSNSRPTNLRGC